MWKKLKSTVHFKNRYFSFREDECQMANGTIVPRYFVMEFPDWVQVVAIDKNKNFIMVDQYRYAGGESFLEFPGGSTEPTKAEGPQSAGVRELAEETGYTSNQWSYLGAHFPNPALMNNRCHVFLAQDCERTQESHLDQYEDLNVKVLSYEQLTECFRKNLSRHSLMLASWQLYLMNCPTCP